MLERLKMRNVVEGHTTISVRCPYCRQLGVFAPASKDMQVVNEQGLQGRAGSRQCPNEECRALVFIYEPEGRRLVLLPPEIIDFDATKLPPAVVASLTEAVQCHAVYCYRASAIMIRRTLEDVCHDKRATGDNLKERLQALSTNVVLPKDLIDGLDALRLLGNDAAHIEAQTYDQVGEDEVRVGINVAKFILQAVYQYGDIVGQLTTLKATQA